MAANRWVCTQACYWKKRMWDPNSPVVKDRVYIGPETPPAKCFRQMENGEAVPAAGDAAPAPIALSTIAKRAGVDPFQV